MKITFFCFMVILHFILWSGLMVKAGFEIQKQRETEDSKVIKQSLSGCRWLISEKNKQILLYKNK